MEYRLPIYIKDASRSSRIANFAKGKWDLPSQVVELEMWLLANQDSIEPGDYIADIGFSMRKEACGGGAILSVEAMKIMSKLGIKLYLSEYPDE